MLSLVVGVILLSTPAYALEKESSPGSARDLLESLDLDRALEGLHRMLWRAEAELRDHFEWKRDVQEKPNGEQQRHFQFKVYPKGKSQSDEHIRAESWVGSQEHSGETDFQFRLRFKGDRDTPPSEH